MSIKEKGILNIRESKYGGAARREKILLGPAIDSSQGLLPLYFAIFPAIIPSSQSRQRQKEISYKSPQETHYSPLLLENPSILPTKIRH